MRRPLALPLVLAFLVGLFAHGIAVPSEVSAETRSVDAWIDVSSMRPSVGCIIDISVEIREVGQPVANAGVELALHVDGALVSADYGVTRDTGAAFFELDTSTSLVGVRHWLDVNVSGEYFTGFPVVTTDSGSCSEDRRLIERSGDISFVPATTASEQPGFGSETKVWVPTYVQQRNLSCEYAALHMVTTAWGDPISEYAFDNLVGWSANPHVGYRGDITGWWGRTDDYGVYAEPLSWALDDYGYYGEVLYAVGNSNVLTSRLDQGIPVIVWLGMWGDQSVYEVLDGRGFTVVAGMHVMVAYGYDESGVYLSDPGTGTYRFYSWADFMWMWNILDGMALAVSPY